ncbi:gamma-tubulin ring complex protein [Rhizoctonia solani 123E]|uniref:Spindle pole body component n=1 Tax=Rhizoctonia solani 123E TaxID=1423351 RepID=A0A074RS51_9AGAM|nr:gamma-tubulin ring complex protein [Rhizoctonia solani 123E]
MLAEVLLIMSGHASSLLEPDGSIAPAFAPLLHPGEQQVLKELATLASQYRKLKQSCPSLGQQSQYMSSLCAALTEILTEYEDLVVETEARILKRDSELVANATVVPLSAIKATFSVWDVQFTALCLLVDQLEAGPPGLDGVRWPPGPLIDLLLQRARTGVQRVAYVTNRLALAVQRVWRSHLLAFLVHGILDATDPLARAADGYKLNPECIPMCITTQTREAIAYVGRAVAVVGVGVPRQLAIVHARLVGRVLPQDRYAFDAAVERIKGNISEWLWSRVLTRADVIGAVECFANYFLLRNGEFALALLREIERLKTSRLSAKPTSRTSGGLIRDTDLSLAILRASLGTSAQNDPSLDSLRFTLVDGPLRPLLPPPSASLVPNRSAVFNGAVLFDDLLLGARATLSHTLAWPLDLVLGQAELQAYGAIFAYLSAMRRSHVMVLECWGTLSGSWRARKKWEGTYARRKAKGKGRVEDLDAVDAEEEVKRNKLVKCAWGVVREMVWFLDTFWGYIMTDVVDVQYRKLYAQLRPQRSRSNSNRRGSTTTRATTRAGSPTSTQFGPSPSTQFGPSAASSHGLNFRASGSAPQPETLDFSTLRTLHATYLANIISGSLLGHPGCASLVRTALETCERFVGMIERWGGDVLPGMLEEGSAGVGWALLDERLKAIKEIDETFHSHLEAFYEQLSMSPGQGADGSTMAGNTSAYLRDLFRPRGKGGKGAGGEDRRTVERLSLRLDFNAKFSEPHGYGYSKQLGILQQGGLV